MPPRSRVNDRATTGGVDVTREWVLTRPCSEPLASVKEVREHLLQARHVLSESSQQFFDPSYDEVILDPLLLPDVDAVVDRIRSAKQRHEKILVYGDYDADGITSTVLLVSTLRHLGCQVTPFLPHRNDHGYGLNGDVLTALTAGVQLVITVDCGISNGEEITQLKKRGVDVIVIDHHQLPTTLPPALAIVHPHRPESQHPFRDFCGAGVAWKVASALLRDEKLGKGDVEREKWLLDLAALGTIADVVPLREENRSIVQFGLQVLQRTQRIGLRRLLEALKLEPADVTAEAASWQVIPRLNAAGRIEHPQPALDLLLSETAAEADVHIATLEALNRKRQTVTKRIMSQAETQLAAQVEQPVIVVHDMSWPAGVVGLAASRLSKQFGRPAFVIGGNGAGATGSVRSPSGTNVVALLNQVSDVLTKHGGHAQAAGFSLAQANIDAFTELVQDAAESPDVDAAEQVEAEAVVAPDLLGRELFDTVERFAPFGHENERPQLIAQNIRLVEARTVGKEGTHAKCRLHIAGETRDAIGFNLASSLAHLRTGTSVDVVGALEENVWQGRRTLQVALTDIAPTGTTSILQP